LDTVGSEIPRPIYNLIFSTFILRILYFLSKKTQKVLFESNIFLSLRKGQYGCQNIEKKKFHSYRRLLVLFLIPNKKAENGEKIINCWENNGWGMTHVQNGQANVRRHYSTYLSG
jgi:hypothetical protein